MPLVLLNLKSTPFRTQAFAFLDNYKCPMHLAPVFDLQLVKGDILQHHKGLTASIENNHALVEQSFHSVLQGNKKTPKSILYNLEISFTRKGTSENILSSLTGRALTGYC